MMLTQKQFDRLPVLFQEIVLNDRRIIDHCSKPIVDFKDFLWLRTQRRELEREADKRFAPLRTGPGGPVTA